MYPAFPAVARGGLASRAAACMVLWAQYSSRGGRLPAAMVFGGAVPAVPTAEKSRGALIVLEGLDRSGKSTQSRALTSFLRARGEPVEEWRFPDRTTAIGGTISSYLSKKADLDDVAIHLLFSANRWEKRALMEAKLRAGTTLVVDRYSYSGVAFTAAKGLDLQWCKVPDTGLPAADLVMYLDIRPEVAARRGEYGHERYEKLDFQNRVASCYESLQDGCWKRVDASQPLEDVQNVIRDAAVSAVESCRLGKDLLRLWPAQDFKFPIGDAMLL